MSLLLCDNGTITIGSYLRILCPYPVERNMKNIPIVRTHIPAIAMKPPLLLYPIPIDYETMGNNSGVAVLSGVLVNVRRTTAIQTTCSGKHCDKQRPMDWARSTSQGCGCWGTSSLGTSNLALMHNIILQDRDDKIKVENFSSTKFNQIFMTGPIPPNTPVTALEATQAFFNLKIAIDDCLDLINENDGFDVVLWYSRGEINDVSMTGANVETEDSQVDSGKMCYHIVEIKPTNKDFSNNSIVNALATELKNSKFSISDNLI